MKTKDLTISDFPGIDEAKFNEWKALQIKTNHEQRIVSYVASGIWLIWTLLTAKPIYPSICLIVFIIAGYGFYRVRNKHLRQLGKELKMSDRLRAKKEGRGFT
jgi:hypothetical protein